MIDAILRALQMSFYMLWEVFWRLAFGFLLSAIVQTVVSKRAVASVVGKPDLKGFVLSLGFGPASSSCSYAAVAVARTLFRRGAHFINAIIFEFASTNLVFELGLVLLILLGWQFLAAEFAGGLARLFSPRAFTAISHYFYMDVYSLHIDLGLGFLIAGALAAWVPNSVRSSGPTTLSSTSSGDRRLGPPSRCSASSAQSAMCPSPWCFGTAHFKGLKLIGPIRLDACSEFFDQALTSLF